MRSSHVVFTVWLGLMAFLPSYGYAENSVPLADLNRLRLEELMEIDITTAAKKPQRLSGVAAAAYVLSEEDIRRSGATNIPDALRMVPGLEVARINSYSWAITARGFNGRFANKLLVMIDGRSVYTPLFSGVYWDTIDTPLEDIERIEIIRGPGGTLWGANAVNGVINIITKSAEKTEGGLLSAGGGSLEKAFATARYGARLGDNVSYRLYTKGFKRNSMDQADGAGEHEDWDARRLGFRLDGGNVHADRYSLQADWYRLSEENELVPAGSSIVDEQLGGGHVLGRWEHRFTPDSELTVQSYYDRSVRHESSRDQTMDVWNLEAQHLLQMTAAQELLWGGTFLLSRADIQGDSNKASRNEQLWSAFLQDEIVVTPEFFRLILGVKVEHNGVTGTELMPNVRFTLTPDSQQTLWAAVSRAVRTPSQATSGTLKSSGAPSVSVTVLDTPDENAEILWAYEVGYRHQLSERIFYDMSLFYNKYSGLLYADKSTVAAGSSAALLVNYNDDLYGNTWGGEALVEARANPFWRGTLSYSYLRMNLDSRSAGGLDRVQQYEGNSPNHQIKLRSLLNLPGQVEFDTLVNYVDYADSAGFSAFMTVSARLGWRPAPSLELSLVGQNLFDARHVEFASKEGASMEVPRSFLGKITWNF